MAEGMAQDERIFLSILPASRGERRMALAVVLLSLLAFAAAAPFARVPLPRVDAFIPIYQSALAINDLITAVLLFGQFAILRAPGLRLLASAYLFTALMVVVHTLSFPGLFSPTGLLAGPQTTAWLYMFWHGGFPLLVLGYTRAKRADFGLLRSAGTARGAVLSSIVAIVAAVIGLTLAVTAGHSLLPAIMDGSRYTPVMIGVVSTVWLLSFLALAALWMRRPHSVLDLWLMVVMCAWLLDVALSAVLNAGRFDLGFYAGRVYGLLAASFVLLVLLLETRALYARLAKSLEAERAEADRRARELEEANSALRRSEDRLRQLNETLEQRVIERSRQLETEIAERERTQEALRETQKREAIGRIAGGIAHDFNNLLTVVQGNAEFLLGSVGKEAEVQAAAAIDRAAGRGARLVRQIMVFSRRQALKPEVVDLRSRTDEITELLKRTLRGDIRLVVTLADDLWPIECDIVELELALMNLCVNARDAMPKGGLVRIDGCNIVLPGDAGRVAGSSGDFVALTVSDAGTGIPPADLERVFEPFFTTKEVGKGTGLGLAQVRGFAQQAGGDVAIASEVGRGTAVTLHLPRAAAALEDSPAEGRKAVARGTGTVLVVEDDDDVAGVAATMLGMIGYTSHHVRDARTALALLLGGQHFDILFSDIIMPGGMNGLELARKVRQHFPKLPILLASGYNRSAADVDREGFNIIAKPYRADALSDALKRSISQTTSAARNIA